MLNAMKLSCRANPDLTVQKIGEANLISFLLSFIGLSPSMTMKLINSSDQCSNDVSQIVIARFLAGI